MLDRLVKRLKEIVTSKPPEQYQLDLFGFDNSIIDKISSWLYAQAINLVEIFEKVLVKTPTVFMKTESFWDMYHDMKLIGFVVLAIALMWAIILKIKGKNFSFEESIIRAFMYPLIVGIAPHLAIRFIRFFNKVTTMIISTESMLVPAKNGFSNSLSVLLYSAVIIVLLGRVLFWYFKKMTLMLFYTMIIPWTMALRCMPKYNKLGKWLFNKMLTVMVTQVSHAVVITILGTIIMGVSELNFLIGLGFQVGAIASLPELESIIKEMLGATSSITGSSFQSSNKQNVKDKAKKGYSAAKKAKKYVKKFIGVLG